MPGPRRSPSPRRYHEGAGLDLPPAPDESTPVVATGHQPELFHPGVWVKNFAVSGLAAKSSGVGLNLIVDDDIPKGAFVRVPATVGDARRTKPLPFDDWSGEVPYEDQPIRDASLFSSFPARVREALEGQIARPLVDRFWSHVMSAPEGMPGAIGRDVGSRGPGGRSRRSGASITWKSR